MSRPVFSSDDRKAAEVTLKGIFDESKALVENIGTEPALKAQASQTFALATIALIQIKADRHLDRPTR